MNLADLTPDIAMKSLLSGKVQSQSAKGITILDVYAQNERPNADLDNEFIEIYLNGNIRSFTTPPDLFLGNLALAIYVKTNSDGTMNNVRLSSILRQVETLVSNKAANGFFFTFEPSNVITPPNTDLSTGYATTVLNVNWRNCAENIINNS